MSKRQVMEILLDGLDGVVTGQGDDEATRHIVTVGLVWPRPGIAKRIAVQPVKLVGGSAAWGEAAWFDRILFKETVMGRFGIEMAVSAPVSGAMARQAMAFFGEGLAKEAASVLGGAAGGILGGIVSVPLRHVAGALLDAAGVEAGIVAAGTLDLDSASLTGKGGCEIPLAAPDAIYRGVRQRPPAPVRGEELLVAAGEANGAARIVLLG
ncbi:MAG: hypothetical protein HN919_08250 [Verrucomicrobia bacterium]|nr:hypothetical protein [Verrucomicrobiota bacterium]MBT7066276.1 hypothetical protein [Verrucomicrobiota bacterium]MBT7700916.1 hypothetical protein [Verrucomicrobiota bacterium]